jgi:hypothetical protein
VGGAAVALLLAIVVAFLVALYRFSPNVRHGWRDCLPGAVLGAALWICAAVAFRVSAAVGRRSRPVPRKRKRPPSGAGGRACRVRACEA